MNNRIYTVILIIVALIALGAVAAAMLTSSPIGPDTGAPPSTAASVSLPPSPPPALTAAASVTAQPAPSPSETAGPLSGYLIGIDPGHQQTPNLEQEPNSPNSAATKAKVSKGAHGGYSGVNEYELNLEVALKLKANLEAMGAKVIMTRETNDVDISNIQRAQIMNEAGVDCWLRIHANNSLDKSVHGMFMIVPAEGCLDTDDASAVHDSRRLADSLLAAALSSTGAHSRGISIKSDQTGFNWSKVPVCTIEMGFMTNKSEDELLTSADYQQKIADGLAKGFADYFTSPASAN